MIPGSPDNTACVALPTAKRSLVLVEFDFDSLLNLFRFSFTLFITRRTLDRHIEFYLQNILVRIHIAQTMGV